MRVSSAAVGASSAALLLASSAAAFRDTSPLLVWSSTPDEGLTDTAAEVTSGAISANAVFGSIGSLGCNWDAVVVVHMDELHQSHVGKLTLPYASSPDLHIPYLVRPEREMLDMTVDEWAAWCDSEVSSSYSASKKQPGVPAFIYLTLENGADVTLPADLPEKHLVVLTGTRDLSMSKRQLSEQEERPFETEEELEPEYVSTIEQALGDGDVVKVAAPSNGTNVPALDVFQIFTTPLISALLVSFGLLLPIALFGIYALAGIQVPPRMMEIGKSLSVDKSRKDQ